MARYLKYLFIGLGIGGWMWLTAPQAESAVFAGFLLGVALLRDKIWGWMGIDKNDPFGKFKYFMKRDKDGTESQTKKKVTPKPKKSVLKDQYEGQILDKENKEKDDEGPKSKSGPKPKEWIIRFVYL